MSDLVVTPPRAHARTAMEPALSDAQVTIISIMAFLLAAMNGVPLSFSSLPFVIALSGLLMIQRPPKAIILAAFGRDMRLLTYCLLGLALASLISAIASGNMDSIGEGLLRTVAPLLPYFALCGIRLRTRHIERILWGFVAGVAFMMMRGSLAFYAEWGIPDLNTALWARYDQFRMTGYMNATLGNLSHMGLYFSLLTPLFVAMLAYFRFGKALTVAIIFVLFLSFGNAFISGSRTAIALIVPAVALIYARRGAGSLLILIFMLTAASLLVATYGIDAADESAIIERFVPSAGSSGYDASAVERVDSVYVGWSEFLAHPILGVGPGLSHLYVPYGIPHQSTVHMLLETGIFGGGLFLFLSVFVFGLAAYAILTPDRDGSRTWRAAWLIGPAIYFLFGIAGGIVFTMSIALVWVGLVYTMLPLAYAQVVGDDEP